MLYKISIKLMLRYYTSVGLSILDAIIDKCEVKIAYIWRRCSDYEYIKINQLAIDNIFCNSEHIWANKRFAAFAVLLWTKRVLKCKRIL